MPQERERFRSVNPSARTYAPRMFFIRLALIIAVLTAAGCAWGKKGSSARIVEGDSSSIKYTGREDAGGPIGGR